MVGADSQAYRELAVESVAARFVGVRLAEPVAHGGHGSSFAGNSRLIPLGARGAHVSRVLSAMQFCILLLMPWD